MFKAMFSRAEVVMGAIVVALLAGWIARGAITHVSDAPTITVFKQWRVVCLDPAVAKNACSVSQDVADAKTGAVVIRFVISGDPTQRKVEIAAPFNVLLPPALGVSLDGGAMKAIPYRTCNGFGCVATITDEKLYDSVLGAKKIRVYYETLNAKVSGWELSMDGYDKAVATMNTAEARRHSWLRRVLL